MPRIFNLGSFLPKDACTSGSSWRLRARACSVWGRARRAQRRPSSSRPARRYAAAQPALPNAAASAVFKPTRQNLRILGHFRVAHSFSYTISCLIFSQLDKCNSTHKFSRYREISMRYFYQDEENLSTSYLKNKYGICKIENKILNPSVPKDWGVL